MAQVDPSALRNALNQNLQKYAGQDVAILLSGGMDSIACLFSLLDVKANPIAYTIHLDGVFSGDFKRAKKLCEVFNIPQVPVTLHKDLDVMAAEIRWLMKYRKLKTKTQIEVCWPLFHATKMIKEPAIVTGLCAGALFCTSKQYALHFKKLKDGEDKFRNFRLANPNHGKMRDYIRYCETQNKEVVLPWLSPNIYEMFIGTKFDEVNKPRQKEPIHQAYPEVNGVLKAIPNVNLQQGDSGIQQNFLRLVRSKYNRNGSKSPIGVYNQLGKSKGEVISI